MLYNTLYVPTWLIHYFDNIINPNENIAFSVSPLCTFLRVCNLTMVGLVINPVYWLISQQPGPIKMRQATRYHLSYIRNYNRIHY